MGELILPLCVVNAHQFRHSKEDVLNLRVTESVVRHVHNAAEENGRVCSETCVPLQDD